MTKKTSENEPLLVRLGDPSEVIRTSEGVALSGPIGTNRELRDGELEQVKGLLEQIGLGVEEVDGMPVTRSGRRTFGISNWRGSKWVPDYDRRKAEENERNS